MSLTDRIGTMVRGLRAARAGQLEGAADMAPVADIAGGTRPPNGPGTARRSPFARLSQRTLRVHLGPQQLHSVVTRGGQPVEGSAQHYAFNNPAGHWQAALDMLRALLLQSEHAAARLPLEISLSHRWCQMVLAPWSDALLSEPGASRFLQTQLAIVYGDDARHWSITTDDAPYGHPRTVCGADKALLQAIQDVAQEQQHRCAVLEPAISAVLRAKTPARRHTSARAPAHALALVEGGRLTMAVLEAGRITALQSQPCGAKWNIELPQAWQRWTLRSPELADIAAVTVTNLDAEPMALSSVLPSRFQLAEQPFGRPAAIRQEVA